MDGAKDGLVSSLIDGLADALLTNLKVGGEARSSSTLFSVACAWPRALFFSNFFTLLVQSDAMLPPVAECDVQEAVDVLLGDDAEDDAKATAVSLVQGAAERFADWLGAKVRGTVAIDAWCLRPSPCGETRHA